MKNEISYVKDIQILKEPSEPDLMAIKARGVASIRKLVAPVLVPRQYDSAPEDGIYELDFTLDDTHQDYVVENSDIELI